MHLGFSKRTILETDSCKALQLPPVAASIETHQPRQDVNAVPYGDGLDPVDLADDLEIHVRYATASRKYSAVIPGSFTFPSIVSDSDSGSTIVRAAAWMSSRVTRSMCSMISSGLYWRPK